MCVSVAATQGNRESDQRKATTGINQARCQDFLKGGYVHGCLMYIYVYKQTSTQDYREVWEDAPPGNF